MKAMGRVVIILFLFIVSVGVNFINANDISNKGTDQELLRDYSQNRLGEDPIWEKYIYNVIYVGMPEEKFVKLFTWDKEFEGTLRPYILDRKENIYYLLEPHIDFMKKGLGQSNIANTGKTRVEFENGLLIRYEIQYWDKPPFIFLVWGDRSAELKGFTNGLGFYKGMSEEEFLKVFSDRILKHRMNQYVFIAKDGKKYQVNFEDGKLYGLSRY